MSTTFYTKPVTISTDKHIFFIVISVGKLIRKKLMPKLMLSNDN